MLRETLIISVLLLWTNGASGNGPFSDGLQRKYKFSSVLAPNNYILYWNFDLLEKSIQFAVNVNTSGWVGFGLSPFGSMEGADIVMGWFNEDSGTATFEDRYGIGNLEPIIDKSQDWFLLGHQKSDGWTSFEFKRNLTTCDDQDLDIEADTARVLWSWSLNNPSCNSNNCKLSKHICRGVSSINLLGGLDEPGSDSDQGMDSFSVTTNNVLIPNITNTTYWCEVHRLPDHIIDTEHYIHKISPVLSPHEYQYVHHMIVFVCPFSPGQNYSGLCGIIELPDVIRACTIYKVLGSWAVGGMDFVLPRGVAFTIGGPQSSGYLALEIHYDNPHLHSGIKDSSGMKFFYTSEPPQYKAGILTLGHLITSNMIIPPSSTRGYMSSGLCVPSCTERHFPKDGIKIFGNIFHTHLIGKEIILRHYRNSSECDGWKELPPVDENKRYDFNLQQFNIIHKEVEVLPGDALELQCLYVTNRDRITLGGYGTSEEMCLTFLAYYPATPLSVCASQPAPEAYEEFSSKYFTADEQDIVIGSVRNKTIGKMIKYFDKIKWTTTAVSDLEKSVLGGDIGHYCVTSAVDPNTRANVPDRHLKLKCPLKPEPKKCTLEGRGSSSGGRVRLPCKDFIIFLAAVAIKIATL